MATPAPAQQMTVNNLYQKIGALAINNDFLGAEVERLNAWIGAHVKGLEDEIKAIEAEIEKGAETDVKSLLARVKAKL